MGLTFGIYLFDGAEELDFAGPWEVLAMLREGAARGTIPVEKPAVVTISQNGGTLTCAKGMRVLSDHSFANAPRLDVLVVPGGIGARREVEKPNVLKWVAATAAHCQWVTSVCTGALLLAAAGPAKGKRVTTHWSFIETLRARNKAKEVVENIRYVRDGNVVTAAGVSAGIDMTLWLVGQIYAPEIAREVQHQIEYNPAPPYTADV